MVRYIRSSKNSYNTITSIDELLDILESGKYNYYGLRGAHPEDMQYLDRGYLEPSYVWEDNSSTEDVLPGTSAVGISDSLSEAEIMNRYNMCKTVYNFGADTVLLLGSSQMDYGEDDNEVILGDNGYGADVIAIVEI